MSCLFCRIVAKEIPAKIVLENDHLVAFHDITPVAPTHILLIPKKHITGMHDATSDDAAVLGRIMIAARDIAEEMQLAPNGYRLVVNTGKDAGQSVFHLHVHLLAGRVMAWPPG